MPEEEAPDADETNPLTVPYGTERRNAPLGASEFEHLLPASRKLVGDLRAAMFVFENEEDGGIKGCMMALQAVAQFLARRHLPFWRIFAEIHAAFGDLQRGVDPELFSRSIEPRSRSRSSRRKHAQLIAAACLGGLMEAGEPLEQAKRTVARKVGKWTEFTATPITPDTIRNWREAILRDTDDRNAQYQRMVEGLKLDPSARKTIADLLESGPPASPRPRNVP